MSENTKNSERKKYHIAKEKAISYLQHENTTVAACR